MVVLISHSPAFTGSRSGHVHAERWWRALLLRKQELNLETRGKSFLVLSFSYFFYFSYLLEPPEGTELWRTVGVTSSKLGISSEEKNAQSFEVRRKWKPARLHQRATLSLLTVKREICNLTGGNITSSFILPVCSLLYLHCTSTKMQ